MSTIIDLLVSKVYIVPTLTGITNPDRVPTPSLGKIRYIQDVKSLQQYQATGESTYGWVNMLPAGTEYVVFAESKPESGHDGQLLVLKEATDEATLHVWMNSAWVQISGGGVKFYNSANSESQPANPKDGTLLIDSSNSVMYYALGGQWISTQPLITVTPSITLGGITGGDDVAAMTMTSQQMWSALLEKEKFASVSGTHSVSLARSPTSAEFGSSIDVTLTASNSRQTYGPVYDASGKKTAASANYQGAITNYNFSGSGMSAAVDNGTTTTYTVEDYTVAASNSWKLIGTFADGPSPIYSSKGNTGSLASYSSGTKEASASITAQYPVYCTKSATGTLAYDSLISDLSNKLEYTYPAEAKNSSGDIDRLAFLIPSALISGTAKVEYYDSVSGKWVDDTANWTEITLGKGNVDWTTGAITLATTTSGSGDTQIVGSSAFSGCVLSKTVSGHTPASTTQAFKFIMHTGDQYTEGFKLRISK